ncbi:DUF488 domain-containing protein [Agrococcus sp. SCSIO52902]|uniref:DUF488 domain-containing protein n=1 Tax=Agrococcus sp. SCSIO52902 TaxID=2933290 RepID=UPI001FF52D50|nr:DUF488 domain-containing protein [Agrococcus sp. SCSIO52902]UOW02073.1 DUF488 domain-containing protein [Agrococcus sp. SCSIO52902]
MGGDGHRVRRPHHRADRAGAPGAAIAATLLTVGHGRLDGDGLRSLLGGAGVELVVDIRRFPGSRANPAASRDAIEGELAAGGIGWRWEERLGGRRRLTAAEDAASPDAWWRVAAFRAYAAWTRSDDFAAALAEVLAEAEERRVAVMCSEAVWWRCHRRVVADVAAVLHGAEPLHLMHDGSLRPHPVSESAVAVDGAVRWPAEAAG